jgi:peptide/nickel transport system ATP-binding protein
MEHFGSACDLEKPDDHVVSETGRWSHCHLHADEYDEEAHDISPE